jgi:tetratricopeptide (TPR) repeat protein
MKQAEALIELGRNLFHEGHFDPAVYALDRAIELEPANAAAYDLRGLIYGELKKYDQSIEDCTMAIIYNENFAGAYCNRGLSYYKKSMFDKALADYDRAIDLSPDISIFYNNRGLVYYELGNIDKAIEDYNQAFELSNDCKIDSEVLNNRGQALMKRGLYELAAVHFDLAIINDPNNIDAFANKAAIGKIGRDGIT